jgi:hypothetical protein
MKIQFIPFWNILPQMASFTRHEIGELFSHVGRGLRTQPRRTLASPFYDKY